MKKLIPLVYPTKPSIVFAQGPFGESLMNLEQNGYEIVSARYISMARINQGIHGESSALSGWVKEGTIHLPSGEIRLTRRSPLIKNAPMATRCNSEGEEFYLSRGELEVALEDSIQITEEIIPTNEFEDNKITKFLFGENAGAYGELLYKNGITKINPHLKSNEEKPFARQLRLLNLSERSKISDHKYLSYCGSGVFGRLKKFKKGA